MVPVVRLFIHSKNPGATPASIIDRQHQLLNLRILGNGIFSDFHMVTIRKFGFVFIGMTLFIILRVLVICFRHVTPESRFRSLFADLSIGVPDYQVLTGFTQPADAVKGDYCIVDFSQSETQFVTFAVRLGVSPTNILSSTGVLVSANSKIDPSYPWMLVVHAYSTNAPGEIYRVHIEGHQPYN